MLSCSPVVPFCLFLFLLVPLASFAAEIGPDANLCQAINNLSDGDELVLRPGEYKGRCVIRRGGRAGQPLTIRAKSLNDKPRVVYDSAGADVLELRASHVVIQGLRFGPSGRNVAAIRIRSSEDITVEDCFFSRLGGIAVAANQNSFNRLVVRRNVVESNGATAMYFGCHNGTSCTVTDILIERNFISGVTAPDPEIGYGIETKLNSPAIIRDNVIVDTKGPGIMVYGASESAAASLIERNFVSGSQTSSGIVVGGGPAVVRNNIAIKNAEAGIGLEDYGGRGLLRSIAILHNTALANQKGGILAPRGKVRDSAIVNNAGVAVAETRVFPVKQAGLDDAGNFDCTGISCFQNPDGLNFSPTPKSPLLKSGVQSQSSWMPKDDFFSAPRGDPPTIGAIERPAGPVTLGIKQ